MVHYDTDEAVVLQILLDKEKLSELNIKEVFKMN